MSDLPAEIRAWMEDNGIDLAAPRLRPLDDIERLELFDLLDNASPGWPPELLESLESVADIEWYLERRAPS